MKKLFALMLGMSSALAVAATTVTFDDGTTIELSEGESLYVSTGTVFDLAKSVAGNGDITYRFRPRTAVTVGNPVVVVDDNDDDDDTTTDNSGFTTASWDGNDRWEQCEAYDPDNDSNLASVQAAWTEACDKSGDGKYEICDDYTVNLFGYTFLDQHYYRKCVYGVGS